ncbi:hypothetical protein J8273_3620 [Carpediemonas membranifera]|uniref:Uncharacterized protein n=1 Tax=Carpediemonas membranifera TaxID=201153 RepID=A0A8J6AWQ8_9EUKA|nr:hypothetical protein J8273_3620 [Carpediemonas membranifera]|eukprot:KAG9393480.1 hypothetical protein J8273_3620 [Carpediemonas membranifera]
MQVSPLNLDGLPTLPDLPVPAALATPEEFQARIDVLEAQARLAAVLRQSSGSSPMVAVKRPRCPLSLAGLGEDQWRTYLEAYERFKLAHPMAESPMCGVSHLLPAMRLDSRLTNILPLHQAWATRAAFPPTSQAALSVELAATQADFDRLKAIVAAAFTLADPTLLQRDLLAKGLALWRGSLPPSPDLAMSAVVTAFEQARVWLDPTGILSPAAVLRTFTATLKEAPASIRQAHECLAALRKNTDVTQLAVDVIAELRAVETARRRAMTYQAAPSLPVAAPTRTVMPLPATPAPASLVHPPRGQVKAEATPKFPAVPRKDARKQGDHKALLGSKDDTHVNAKFA